MPRLRGIAWAHTRGYAPMVATAQAFQDLRADIEIAWERRSLWAFGEAPLEELVEQFDLLVVDYPFVPLAAARELFLPLDDYLPQATLATLERESVGPSYRSYLAGGRLWALPIDAAAEVAAYRADLLAERGLAVPGRWDEVLSLARETGLVTAPLSPVNAWCTFLTLCANQGEEPLTGSERVVSRETGAWALDQLRTFVRTVGAAALETNPIQVLNHLATRDDLAYVPWTFGYSNYARPGYAPRRLRFGPIPSAGRRGSAGSTLGGAGLAISSACAEVSLAVEYAAWVASAECQRTLYVLGGGQPANRVAWEDPLANEVTGGFFRDTLATLDDAYLRRAYVEFPAFQTRAADLLHDALAGRRDAGDALDTLDALYAASRAG